MNRNCPNCGAPFSLEETKCPYCGTLYFNMECLDFDNRKPVFIRYKVPYSKRDNMIGHGDSYCYITQCAIPKLENVEISHDVQNVVDTLGNVLHTFDFGRTASTNIVFDCIPYGDDRRLFDIQVEDEDEQTLLQL